jgi:hypothetical protein
LPAWLPLCCALWAALAGLTLGAAALIAAYEGAPALAAFLAGAATSLAVDQAVQWRDVYQEVFEVLFTQLAAEALRLKPAAALFGEALDVLSAQSLLFDDGGGGGGDCGAAVAEAGAARAPASRAGVGQLMTLWLASRSVDEE